MTRVGNQTNSTDPQAVNSRIFVGNLNTYVVSKEDVERIFLRYGRIIGISMHKGYAFVQYMDTWDARNAVVGEDGRTVAGQILDVNMVSEPKPHQISRKRQIFVNNSTNTFPTLRQTAPPMKRPRTDMLGFTVAPRPKARPAKLSEKQQAALNALYSNGDPDILICGNCKELFPGIHKLIEHKKQSCKLRFTCRCQHNINPPGAPSRAVCARCQSQLKNWWELVQHVQTVHGLSVYQNGEEASSATGESLDQDDLLQMSSQSTDNTTSLAQEHMNDTSKEGSSCSDCHSRVAEWDVLDVNNGAVEEEDRANNCMEETEIQENHAPTEQEDKAVDTSDLTSEQGQG